MQYFVLDRIKVRGPLQYKRLGDVTEDSVEHSRHLPGLAARTPPRQQGRSPPTPPLYAPPAAGRAALPALLPAPPRSMAGAWRHLPRGASSPAAVASAARLSRPPSVRASSRRSALGSSAGWRGAARAGGGRRCCFSSSSSSS